MELTKSIHANLLNDLDEMQQSPAYAVRRSVLWSAESTIVDQEKTIAALRSRLEAVKEERDQAKHSLANQEAITEGYKTAFHDSVKVHDIHLNELVQALDGKAEPLLTLQLPIEVLALKQRLAQVEQAYSKREMIGFVETDSVGARAVVRFKYDGDATAFIQAITSALEQAT